MKKVLIIESPYYLSKLLSDLLKSRNITAFCPKNEQEANIILKNEQIEAIIIEPMLPSNFLTDAIKETNVKYIQSGLFILEKIEKINKDFNKNPKIIINTLVSFQDLIENDFLKIRMPNYFYFRKPTLIDNIIEKINLA